ncbi:T9SS type A sorting domain-containing protein [Gangjinia marincola]|uniref:T9SS type A sorting domain-containing protein n=1 Tax=Gangjinia marincola TaxID=578463 RepID=UPI003CD09742
MSLFDFNNSNQALTAFEFFEFCNNLEVNAFSSDEFAVYPNPSKAEWTISTSTVADRIIIYDVKGKLILSILPSSTFEAIDNQNLSRGLYLARITLGIKQYTFHLIKQ